MSNSAGTPREITRRQMLRRIGLTALFAGPAASVLSACATSGAGEPAPSATASGAATSAANPFGVKADAALEVVIFKGGLGDSYATDVHEPMYKKEFPKASVKHVATQQIAQTLQPRFASGDVPDFIANSGTDLMDMGALQSEGQLLDLTPLFDAPSPDDPSKTVKDTLIPGTVESGQVAGKPYILNYVASTYGLWYNAKLFQEKGWTPPKTFDEFKTLCETIKKAGITPYAYAGKNAAYYQYWMILITAAKVEGNQVLMDIDNLVDGVWNRDSVKQSAAAWAEIGKFMDKSYEGLIHTEVQTRQNQDKVALYPSGSWLENEQKSNTPDTFEYALTPTPSLTSADKMPFEAVRSAAGEPYIIPSKGKNTAGALEYARIMLSKEGAKGFTEKSGSLTVVVGAADGLSLSPGLKSVNDAVKAAGSNNVTYSSFENWYKELETELRKQTNSLMFGRISAEEFCANMQKKADSVKADSSITKQNRTV
ncbi:carbohydrate ABC transporter, N-acetylglucosamine/diacetylchitobiose-binding protein [Sphaerisporangium melleum]|uniref:Carbohydrate ABC transporter, N-acetylglucosamine/diacetylchitobiose-binding protein n=1 Tax=Sphaerisporangium melleum TaxID=321316 RepID=A0A917VFT1_9ACTN|nr:N-acetylglucosamine/diacetylchitobiose ABC transporter substrate-binding protein [Sphaerisporangium melleum]GGK76094.1 carbohydrate ABC transporter, N-acetylglucosamine/diacetylchitobiose-binding protein [Sphaerisporangium melleum]GII72712.1 carbohydrate ABC transporter, N-acetylglucosamine/diacetylchitobiose-binding protein [Sphaerisporangium melleum]